MDGEGRPALGAHGGTVRGVDGRGGSRWVMVGGRLWRGR